MISICVSIRTETATHESIEMRYIYTVLFHKINSI